MIKVPGTVPSGGQKHPKQDDEVSSRMALISQW